MDRLQTVAGGTRQMANCKIYCNISFNCNCLGYGTMNDAKLKNIVLKYVQLPSLNPRKSHLQLEEPDIPNHTENEKCKKKKLFHNFTA
jgi:hypothetical protein